MPHEFELIDQIVAGLGKSEGLVLGPGDDCALTDLRAGHALASSIDCFVPDRHFPRDADAWFIAGRCFRAALSDLAAMGARPKFALIALTVETSDQAWVQAFTEGIRDTAVKFECPIAGGNLSKGPMNMTFSVHGEVPMGQALTRSGAKTGEDVYVSGILGGAARGLAQVRSMKPTSREAIHTLAETSPDHPLVRYWLPEPRLALGQSLIGIASAAIDISDGLLADAWHIAKASGTGLRLQASCLPEIGEIASSDDYELLFTAPRQMRARIESLRERVTRIGETCAELGVWLGDEPVSEFATGFRHFSA